MNSNEKIDSLSGSFASGLRRLAGLTCAAVLVTTLVSLVPATRIDAGTVTIRTAPTRAVRSRITGLVHEVLVTHGAPVKAGQVVARLDASELNHQIETLQYQIAILNEESTSALGSAAAGMMARIAERRQTIIKLRSLNCDLKFLENKRQGLEIRASIDGNIATEDPDDLVGSQATAGEPLLQIVPATPAARS